MLRTWIKRLALTGVSLVLGLLALELALRLLGLGSELLYRPDARFGWGHYAGERFSVTTEGHAVDIAINSHGLRGPERPYSKPPGVFRVLVLGDSFMEALQVPYERSFAALLERELGRGGAQVEVINGGTSGYGTDSALLFYRHEGRRYAPDLVVLGFCMYNDVRNNLNELEVAEVGGSRKPYFVLGADGLEAYPFERPETLASRIKLWLNRHVRLYVFARIQRDNRRHRDSVSAAGMPPDFNVFRAEPPVEWERAWEITDALVARLADEVRQDGAALWVMPIPSQEQVVPAAWERARSTYPELLQGAWDLEAPQRRLARILVTHRIASIDLVPEFRAAADSPGAPLYLEIDGHWTEAGHELAAGAAGATLRF